MMVCPEQHLRAAFSENVVRCLPAWCSRRARPSQIVLSCAADRLNFCASQAWSDFMQASHYTELIVELCRLFVLKVEHGDVHGTQLAPSGVSQRA